MENSRIKAKEEIAKEKVRLLNNCVKNMKGLKTPEERRKALEECYKKIDELGDVERRRLVKERKKNMEYNFTEGVFKIKSGVPSVLGDYDFTRPNCFYYEYLNGLDEYNQDWQIDEYEKLNKKVYKLLTRYLIDYVNKGYDKRREEIQQDILTGYYRRMMILCLEKDMSFNRYVSLSEEDVLDLTDGHIYTYTLHDFWMNDILGIDIELYRKIRFDGSYMNIY